MKKAYKKFRLVDLAILLILFILVQLAGNGEGKTVDSKKINIASLPPIDMNVIDNPSTATFALG